MANIEKAANGWIIRGWQDGKPVTYVAKTKEELFEILGILDL